MITCLILTESSRVAKKSLYDKTDGKIQKWAKTISAIVVIVGALAGVYSWVSSQFAKAVSEQISDFQQETRESDTELQQSVTRVELLELIEHDPDNVVAIEKLARYYFVNLKGDKWMSERYSRYAKEHNLDASFVIGDK